MAKPERNFINRIHRKLDPNLYKQAMGLTSTNGTPDYYYEGLIDYLWTEYKWYPEEPSFVELYNTACTPSLSKLQQNWLKRAHKNNINVAVVAGYPKGCVVLFANLWEVPWGSQPNADNLECLEDHKWTEIEWVKYLNGLQTDVPRSDLCRRDTK